MSHVIGLFAQEEDLCRSIIDLRAAGFHLERIGLDSREQVVGDVMGYGSGRIVAIYAGGGALLGLLVYGISALLANWCQCNLFNFSPIVQLGTFIGGVLAGTFVGGSLGVFVGIRKLEEITAVYGRGRRMNGKLVDVRVSGEHVDHVKSLLQRHGAYEVRIV